MQSEQGTGSPNQPNVEAKPAPCSLLPVSSTLNLLFFFAFITLLFAGVAVAPAVEVEQKLTEMTFEKDAHGWNAERNCRAFLEAGVLRVEAIGGPPTLSRLVDRIGGRIEVVAEIRTLAESSLNAYWTTRSSPRRSNENMQSHPMIADGQWHEYRFQLPVPDYLSSFSFRFTANEGIWEIRKIRVFRHRPHPITLQKVEPLDYKAPNGKTYSMMRYTIYNDAPVSLKFHVEGQNTQHEIGGRDTIDLLAPLQTEGNLAAANVLVHPDEFPAIGFPVFRYDESGQTDWLRCPLGGNGNLESPSPILEIAPDARMARLKAGSGEEGGQVVAVLGPLVHRNGVIPQFSLSSDSQKTESTIANANREWRFDSEEVSLTIRIEGCRIRVEAEQKETDTEKEADTNDVPLEGPVVRVLGTLRSGLLPGVEFLGPGDVSSSTIDLEEPNNQRSTPPRWWITMPL